MGRKAKRDYHKDQNEDSSDEDVIVESGVNWLDEWNGLDKRLSQIIETAIRHGDYRFKWLDLSQILYPKIDKQIYLKDAEAPYFLAHELTREIKAFYEKNEDAMNNDEKFYHEKSLDYQDLKGLNEVYENQTLELIYQRICRNICNHFVLQEA